jgi:hypothetical protein
VEESSVSKTVMLLWAIVLVEIVSPLPAFLSLGAAWVLLTRPPWLPRLVRELYGADGDGGAERNG